MAIAVKALAKKLVNIATLLWPCGTVAAAQ